MTHYLYISGPITGQEDTAEKRFLECEEWIMENTLYTPFNPYFANIMKLSNDGIGNPTSEDYMRSSFYFMTIKPHTSIVFLPGFQFSHGCNLENWIAVNLKYNKMFFDPSVPIINGIPKEMMK